MANVSNWYVKAEDGNVYGPADEAKLIAWAKDGRIDPSSFVSTDRISWSPAQTLPQLEMKWLIETEPGKVFGPFNRAVVIRLFKNGEAGQNAKAYRLHEFPVDQDPPPIEKIVEVEKIVEKVVEKEVVKEVRVEVPVEKIVEVEKVVEVPPPARTQLVVAEVMEPVAAMPPVKSPGSLFDKVGRDKLAALESAARKELAAAGKRGFGFSFGLHGGRK